MSKKILWIFIITTIVAIALVGFYFAFVYNLTFISSNNDTSEYISDSNTLISFYSTILPLENDTTIDVHLLSTKVQQTTSTTTDRTTTTTSVVNTTLPTTVYVNVTAPTTTKITTTTTTTTTITEPTTTMLTKLARVVTRTQFTDDEKIEYFRNSIKSKNYDEAYSWYQTIKADLVKDAYISILELNEQIGAIIFEFLDYMPIADSLTGYETISLILTESNNDFKYSHFAIIFAFNVKLKLDLLKESEIKENFEEIVDNVPDKIQFIQQPKSYMFEDSGDLGYMTINLTNNNYHTIIMKNTEVDISFNWLIVLDKINYSFKIKHENSTEYLCIDTKNSTDTDFEETNNLITKKILDETDKADWEIKYNFKVQKFQLKNKYRDQLLCVGIKDDVGKLYFCRSDIEDCSLVECLWIFH